MLPFLRKNTKLLQLMVNIPHFVFDGQMLVLVLLVLLVGDSNPPPSPFFPPSLELLYILFD